MRDIHNFSNTADYLSILNGVLITDLSVILLLIGGFIKSNVLKKWYKDLSLSAVIADVLIIVIGIYKFRSNIVINNEVPPSFFQKTTSFTKSFIKLIFFE